MATFQASFMQVIEPGRARSAGTMPVPDLSSAIRLDALTTGASSQVLQSDGADWVAPQYGFLRIVCDGEVNVAAGTNPIASDTAGLYVPAYAMVDVSLSAGEQIAVVEA